MGKSEVTDYFLEYFEKNRINIKEISEKTGIKIHKISKEYKTPLTAEEFFRLCVFLRISPEEIRKNLRRKE